VTQLKSALQQAGYRSSDEIRAERDRTIAALVKARKHKRKGIKQLKERLLVLVKALQTGLPIAIALFVVFGMPSVALAHPGHGDHGGLGGLDPSGLVVVVGVTLGLAAHAWASWGPRRRLVAAIDGGGDMGGGSMPGPTVESMADTEPTAEHQLSQLEHAVLKPYYTVLIPYIATGATEWHPTESTGPFSQLSRGAFPTMGAACVWADMHLGGTTYKVAYVHFDGSLGRDVIETVYTFEPSDRAHTFEPNTKPGYEHTCKACGCLAHDEEHNQAVLEGK
jgi:hypothetical protein